MDEEWLKREMGMWEYNQRQSKLPRTLSQLHDLFDEAKARSEKRQKDLSDYIYMIMDNTAEVNGSHRIYTTFVDKETQEDVYYYYEFTRYSYGISSRLVEFDKTLSAKQQRNDKIDFALSMDEDTYEMYDEFLRLSKMTSTIQWRVAKKIENIIVEKLRSHFRTTNTRPSRTFKIDVAGRKYTIITKDPYARWFDFEWVIQDEIDEMVIDELPNPEPY